MLQAIQKIPHGWLPPKAVMPLVICGSLLLFSLFPVGLLAWHGHQPIFYLYVAIAMATHFAIKFILLLGVAEHLDSDVLSSLLLHLGFVLAFLTRGYFGLGLLATAFSIKIIVLIVSSVQKRYRKRALTRTDFSSAPPR